MSASTNTPAAGTGPDATLNFQDPTTWVMVFSALGAVLVRAVPAIAGWHVDSLYTAFALIAASIVVAVGAFSKHHLAAGLGKIASTVPVALEAAAPAVKADLGVDVQPLADRLTAVEQQVAALPKEIPVSELQAALVNLIGGPKPQ